MPNLTRNQREAYNRIVYPKPRLCQCGADLDNDGENPLQWGQCLSCGADEAAAELTLAIAGHDAKEAARAAVRLFRISQVDDTVEGAFSSVVEFIQSI